MRKVEVREARRILIAEEEQNLIDMDAVYTEAIERAEQDGIVFLDEIDKVAGPRRAATAPDVSREGVQRDILPIVEGSTVNTKYGPVQHRSHALHRRGRVPRLQGDRPDSRIAGPLPGARGR